MPNYRHTSPNRGVTTDATGALRGRVSRRLIVGLAALSLAAGVVIYAPTAATPSYASTYPTWDDVQKAKNDEAAKRSEISKIESLIAQLKDRVASTKAAAEKAGAAYYDAEQKLALANEKVSQLEKQSKAEAAKADKSAKQAGEIAAQKYRDGGEDTTLQLLFSGSAKNTDDLLEKLGEKDMLIQHNKSVHDEAVKAKNTAKSLGDQASVEREARDKLKKDAAQKFQEAQAASRAAEQALADQDANLATLEAQLAALKDNTTKVVKGYADGVAAAKKAEAERKAREAAEAKRRAEEEAKRQQEQNNNSGGGSKPNTGGGNSGGGNSGGGNAGSGGWVRPLHGVLTSTYGPRYSQCGPSYCATGYHEGIDLASYCGDYVYAAHSGTVSYAGANGGYGNYVRIEHGNGVSTGYGHNQWGGLLVSSGQWVNAGQAIALEGNTGNSFGCHSHFEVRIWGSTVNPRSYLADRGIYY